jgi:DNA-directed RNA polymerase subunit omega
MLYPPIDELVNITESKYALVTIAAKRARQLLESKKSLIPQPVSHTYVGIALEEIYDKKISFKRK